jgi:hypothetical protein
MLKEGPYWHESEKNDKPEEKIYKKN